MDDVELIIVDDGSVDGTAEKLDACRDALKGKARILLREHGGVSSARNAGIEAASGEWVAFMDCDDCLMDGFLRKSLPLLDNRTDLYIFSFERVELLPDGRLSPRVCLDENRWYDNRRDRIFPDGIVIPGIDRVLAEVKRLHPRMGHLKWIGWDFTLDEEGDPLLIEFNSAPGDSAQRVCGRPLFGEMTDWILEDCFRGRSMEDNQRQGCWSTNEDITRFLA